MADVDRITEGRRDSGSLPSVEDAAGNSFAGSPLRRKVGMGAGAVWGGEA